jgi:hypothetical protein
MSAELVLSGVTKEAIDAAVAAVHRENWDLFAKLDHLESDPVVQARLVKVRPTPDRRRDRRWTPAAPHRSLKGQQSMEHGSQLPYAYARTTVRSERKHNQLSHALTSD